MTDKRLQWHPAFIAAMQIDFGEEADRLIFLSELELNKMPMRIDALVIKKNGSEPLKKNMGRLLKGHNIFEYKSPEENRWLGSLRTDLQPDQSLNVLFEDYEQHKDSKLYQAAMDLIVRANPAAMEEARSMCEALHELWAEDLEKATKEIAKEITKEVTEEVTNKVTIEVTNKVTKEVTNKVTKEVTRNDILLFVEILLEDGYGESTVCEKLHQKFHLKKEDIQDYIQQVRNRSN